MRIHDVLMWIYDCADAYPDLWSCRPLPLLLPYPSAGPYPSAALPLSLPYPSAALPLLLPYLSAALPHLLPYPSAVLPFCRPLPLCCPGASCPQSAARRCAVWAACYSQLLS